MGGSGGVAGIVRDDRALSGATAAFSAIVSCRLTLVALVLSGVSSRSGVVGGADSVASVARSERIVAARRSAYTTYDTHS